MPRPKRSKIAPSVPIQRVQTSTNTVNAKAVSSPQSSLRDTTNSDDSEGLVKKNKTGLNRNGVARKDVFMSGALGPEDVGGTRSKPLTGRQRVALSRIVRETDHVRAIEALKRRRDEALAKESGEQAVVPSSMPEVDAVIEAHATSEKVAETRSVERQRSSVVAKVQAIPATESSIFALANFKRRTRQPSILQIGRHDEPDVPIHSGEELDEFQPDDESTPFHLSKSRSQLQSTPRSHLTSSSSQRLPSSSSRKRKLTPPDMQVRQSQSPLVHSPPAALPTEALVRLQTTLYDLPNDEEVPELELPSMRTVRAQTPDVWSDTMAPPQSSSPSHEPAQAGRLVSTAKAKVASARKPDPKQSKRNLAPKPPTSNPKVSNKPHPLKTITTASLQNLLPRRRRRAPPHEANEFDIPGSSDAELDIIDVPEDEDELSSAAPLVKKTRAKPNNKVTRGKGIKKGIKTGVGGKAQPKHPIQSLITAKSKPKQNPPTKTYTRRVSDKENTALSDSSSLSEISTPTDNEDTASSPLKRAEPSAWKPSKELKTLAEKFKEVDQWTLEFEEVTASSSSPRDAR
ncbi:MAG: hypothetical protein Q9187_000837 [Circinaria calcarea]